MPAKYEATLSSSAAAFTAIPIAVDPVAVCSCCRRYLVRLPAAGEGAVTVGVIEGVVIAVAVAAAVAVRSFITRLVE